MAQAPTMTSEIRPFPDEEDDDIIANLIVTPDRIEFPYPGSKDKLVIKNRKGKEMLSEEWNDLATCFDERGLNSNDYMHYDKLVSIRGSTGLPARNEPQLVQPTARVPIHLAQALEANFKLEKEIENVRKETGQTRDMILAVIAKVDQIGKEFGEAGDLILLLTGEFRVHGMPLPLDAINNILGSSSAVAPFLAPFVTSPISPSSASPVATGLVHFNHGYTISIRDSTGLPARHEPQLAQPTAQVPPTMEYLMKTNFELGKESDNVRKELGETRDMLLAVIAKEEIIRKEFGKAGGVVLLLEEELKVNKIPLPFEAINNILGISSAVAPFLARVVTNPIPSSSALPMATGSVHGNHRFTREFPQCFFDPKKFNGLPQRVEAVPYPKELCQHFEHGTRGQRDAKTQIHFQRMASDMIKLQKSEMLQGLTYVVRTPIPSFEKFWDRELVEEKKKSKLKRQEVVSLIPQSLTPQSAQYFGFTNGMGQHPNAVRAMPQHMHPLPAMHHHMYPHPAMAQHTYPRPAMPQHMAAASAMTQQATQNMWPSVLPPGSVAPFMGRAPTMYRATSQNDSRAPSTSQARTMTPFPNNNRTPF